MLYFLFKNKMLVYELGCSISSRNGNFNNLNTDDEDYDFRTLLNLQNYIANKYYNYKEVNLLTIFNNLAFMSYVYIIKYSISDDDEDYKQVCEESERIKKAYPNLIKMMKDENLNRIIVAFLITTKSNEMLRNTNQDVIEFMDSRVEDMSILEKLYNQYLMSNNTSLTNTSYIINDENLIKFWLKRNNINSTSEFAKYFKETFKDENDDSKYEYPNYVIYSYYINVIRYLNKS